MISTHSPTQDRATPSSTSTTPPVLSETLPFVAPVFSAIVPSMTPPVWPSYPSQAVTTSQSSITSDVMGSASGGSTTEPES